MKRLKMVDEPKLPTSSTFYYISKNEDGTVDIYLKPKAFPLVTEDGLVDYDINCLVIKGIEPFSGIEEDIRTRFYDWCESAEAIKL
jgi:hypothetical protein